MMRIGKVWYVWRIEGANRGCEYGVRIWGANRKSLAGVANRGCKEKVRIMGASLRESRTAAKLP